MTFVARRAWGFRVALLVLLSLAVRGAAVRAEAAAAPADVPTLLLVLGAAGEEEYGADFLRQADLWTQAAGKAEARVVRIGAEPQGALSDHDRLRQTIGSESTNGTAALWVVLIGHGTFDGKEARYNLRGPDLTASELADWLKPSRRPLIAIDTTASSSPFLAKLSATNRVVVSATRSGHEQSYARFGSYLAEAIASPASDLDQDGQTSLLEAFLSASHRSAEWYKTEGRLATEHALIDDTGDGLGTPADWFRGVRAIKQAQSGAALDGVRAHQVHFVMSPDEAALPAEVRARRDALELEVVRWRDAKGRYAETEYYLKLEQLLLDLARLQEGKETPPPAAR